MTTFRLHVRVVPRAGLLDPQGQAVEGSLEKLGFPVAGVRVGRVIDLEVAADDVDDARRQVELMCASLIANSLIESFEILFEEE